MGGNQWVIGRRTSDGWQILAFRNQAIPADTDHTVQVIIQGSQVELFGNGVFQVAHTFGGDLSDGDVGLATRNSITEFDDFGVQEFIP